MLVKWFHKAIVLLAILMAGTTVRASELEAGLRFHSYETEPDSRTSFSVEDLRFGESMVLSFDLKIEAGREPFGYVCRIVTDGTAICDILLTTPVGGVPYIATAGPDGVLTPLISYDKIHGWSHLSVTLKAGKGGSISCLAGDEPIAVLQNGMRGRHSASFYFGSNHSKGIATTDVAPMIIRNLSISRGHKVLDSWPMLCETDLPASIGSGEVHMDNAAWLVDSHRQWSEIASFRSPSMFFIADDSSRERIYLINSGRVILFELDGADSEAFPFSQKIKSAFLTNDFRVLEDGSLVYVDFDNPNPVQSRFDFSRSAWDKDNIAPPRHSRFSHHCSFRNPVDGSEVQLFGYGFHTYLNECYSLAPDGHVSHGLLDIPPRYLSSAGLRDSVAYVLGGKGSPKGQQELGVTVYNDIWILNLKDWTVSPAGHFENPESLVPTQGLKVHGDTLTGLFFDSSVYKTSLRLMDVSLSDGSMRQLAEEIPFNFLDIESNAMLSATPEALYAVASYRTDKEHFTAKVYRLDLPIFTTPAVPVKNKVRIPYNLILVFFLICVSIAVFTLNLRIRRHQKKLEDFEIEKAEVTPGIYLLGNFRVIDAEGKDVSALFTPLMKQLLCVLVLYTEKGNGISNAELKELLWSDKSEESYFNNRGVMIKKIRTVLSGVSPAIEIQSESGYWSVSIPDGMCDYFTVASSLRKGRDAQAISSAALSGPLLSDMRYDWLDRFKAEYADSVIETLTRLNSSGTLGAEAQLKVSDAILSFDSIDEDATRTKCRALISLKRAGTARSEFDRFTEQYASLLGEKYTKSFSEFLNG